LSRKSRPDLARCIADHFAAALKYCEVENSREEEDEARVPIFQYRSASIHGRLATLYHHCLRYGAAENSPESNFVKNVQLYRQMAESHYDKASALYSAVEDHGELIRCLLEHISLQEFQVKSWFAFHKGQTFWSSLDSSVSIYNMYTCICVISICCNISDGRIPPEQEKLS
jgi:hypothetical protein